MATAIAPPLPPPCSRTARWTRCAVRPAFHEAPTTVSSADPISASPAASAAISAVRLPAGAWPDGACPRTEKSPADASSVASTPTDADVAETPSRRDPSKSEALEEGPALREPSRSARREEAPSKEVSPPTPNLAVYSSVKASLFLSGSLADSVSMKAAAFAASSLSKSRRASSSVVSLAPWA